MAQNISNKQRRTTLSKELKNERNAGKPGEREAFAKSTLELLSYGVPIGVVGNLSAKAAAKLLTKYKNYQKVQNTPSISLYRAEPGYKTFSQTKKMLKDDPQYGKWFSEGDPLGNYGRGPTGVLKKVTVSQKEYQQLLKGMKDSKQGITGPTTKGFQAKEYQFKPGTTMRKKNFDTSYVGTVPAEIRRRATVVSKKRPEYNREQYFKDLEIQKTVDKLHRTDNLTKKLFGKKKGGAVKKRAVSKRVKVTRGDGIAKRGKTRGRMV
jgi:hypothetical protein